MLPNQPQQGPKMVISPGGIALPEAEALRQRLVEAQKWVQVLLSFCPKIGPYEVADGTPMQQRPMPINPSIPTGLVLCPECSTEEHPVYHMANMVLVTVKEREAYAFILSQRTCFESITDRYDPDKSEENA